MFLCATVPLRDGALTLCHHPMAVIISLNQALHCLAKTKVVAFIIKLPLAGFFQCSTVDSGLP
jgi:hypothetical protein